MGQKRTFAEQIDDLAEVAPRDEPGEYTDELGTLPALDDEDTDMQKSLPFGSKELRLRAPLPEGEGTYAGRTTSRREALGFDSDLSSEGFSPRGTQDSADEDEEQVGATPKARTGHLRPVATGQTQHGLGEQYAQLEADDAAALGAEFKRRRMRDAVRGSAVARQRQIWERLLEIRIMLQRALTASHALPSPPGYEAAITMKAVKEGFGELSVTMGQALEALLSMHGALVQQVPDIGSGQGSRADHPRHRRGDSAKPETESLSRSVPWNRLQDAYSEICGFRDATLDQWHRQVMLASGSAAMRANLKALGQGVAAQVHQAMATSSDRLTARMQLAPDQAPKRLCDPSRGALEAGPGPGPSPDCFDDAQFYQQLLSEFLEAAAGSLPAHAPAVPQAKKRRHTQHRSSKGRRLRYDVQDKLVNFMAPINTAAPVIAFQLFHNLFAPKP